MSANHKHTATVTLTAVAAGFFISYPFQHNFWGGMLTSGFSAAMVGGLADWFAVTALFRKPLHIPFRTAIIPKNRERIMAAIVAMVEEELLTAANIRDTLNKVGLARLVLSYVGQPDARRSLDNMTGEMARQAAAGIDAARLTEAVNMLLTEHKARLNVAPLIGQAIEWSINDGFADRLTDLIVTELKRMVSQNYMAGLIASIYSGALEAYAARQSTRKLVNWILENLLKLDPNTVVAIIQAKLVEFLDSLHNPDHRLRQKLSTSLTNWANDLQTSAAAGQWLENSLRPQLIRLAGYIAELPADNPEFVAGWLKWAARQVKRQVDEFTASACRRQEFDGFLADWLARWVNDNHGEIGRMVAVHLDSFSNVELAAYIENKVSDDLQIIRVNGSVVGGLAGIVLFMITYVLGVGR